MVASPAGSTSLEFEGILFRQYFIGRFAVGGNGSWGSSPTRIQTPWTLTRVMVSLRPAQLVVEVISNPFGIGGAWRYHEVECAQAFWSPGWTRRLGISWKELPIGIRLHFGESRPALLIFTTEYAGLLDGLESHHINVERTPIKLNPMLIGRK